MNATPTIIYCTTAEAEYIAVCETTMKALTMRNILKEVLPRKVNLGIASQTAFVMGVSLTYRQRTRHIDRRCIVCAKEVIILRNVDGEENLADRVRQDIVDEASQALLQLFEVSPAPRTTHRLKSS